MIRSTTNEQYDILCHHAVGYKNFRKGKAAVLKINFSTIIEVRHKKSRFAKKVNFLKIESQKFSFQKSQTLDFSRPEHHKTALVVDLPATKLRHNNSHQFCTSHESFNFK